MGVLRGLIQTPRKVYSFKHHWLIHSANYIFLYIFYYEPSTMNVTIRHKSCSESLDTYILKIFIEVYHMQKSAQIKYFPWWIFSVLGLQWTWPCKPLPRWRNTATSMLCYAKSLQSCPTLCDPIHGSHQAPPSLGFSRQEHWSGLPFPSPMHESEKWSEVAQSCPTLSDPMHCSLPGSSVHGIFQARVLEWGAIATTIVVSFY